MKKMMVMALCLCFVLPCLSTAAAGDASPERLNIVSTIFPPYDFAREITDGNADVSMLLSPGSESHSFEPSPQDIIKIQNADVFIYIGGETDAWVDRILGSMSLEDTLVLSLLDMVQAVPEEIVEGMEHDHGHDHGEIDPDAVYDRPLSDWAGGWASLAPLLPGGELDAYLAPLAAENGSSLEETRATQAQRWQSDYDALSIEGDTLTIGGESGAYSYAGYAIVESGHGASVWYQYRSDAPGGNLPAYIMFSDHGTGGQHEEHEAHDHHETAHTHMRYGNEGFPALLEAEGWSPFYVSASATPQEIVEMLTDHSHEETELDEHVWTSPRNAAAIVSSLADTLGSLDPDNAALYRENADAYLEKLHALDQDFQAVMEDAVRNIVVFGDRFPFRYLADAYGLTYSAAFPGCATETEASASTIAFLIDKVREEAIPVVFTIEFSNGRIANVICESTGAKKLQMHSCHNVSREDFQSGVGYLDLMQANVNLLKEAVQ